MTFLIHSTIFLKKLGSVGNIVLYGNKTFGISTKHPGLMETQSHMAIVPLTSKQ